MQVDRCQHRAPGRLDAHTEAVLPGVFANSGPIREAGVDQGDQPSPGEEGPHAHAVRQAGQPHSGELSARLLQLGDVGPRTGQVCDEAWDFPGVRPEAAAVGRDHTEAAHVRGAALQVLQRVVRQAEHIRGILVRWARFRGWRLAAGTLQPAHWQRPGLVRLRLDAREGSRRLTHRRCAGRYHGGGVATGHTPTPSHFPANSGAGGGGVGLGGGLGPAEGEGATRTPTWLLGASKHG